MLAALLLVLGAACGVAGPPPPLEIDGPALEIVPPVQPIPTAALVTPGSFVRSKVSPQGVRVRFIDELKAARVFKEVLDTTPPGGPAPIELELAGADYGEPDAYTLELGVSVLRQRKLITSYFSKQSIRQPKGSSRQLTIGPPELGKLAERAIRDLIRQLAADAPRLAAAP